MTATLTPPATRSTIPSSPPELRIVPHPVAPPAASIYRDALGDEFERLHPRMQRRFGFSSADEICQIGTGVMDEVWRGPWWTVPFLMLGSTQRVLFPNRGRNIPFTVANYAYLDSFGRETVTWSRRFQMRRCYRSFDATMIHSHERDTIVDYLGTGQHMAVDIACSVDDEGAMCIKTGAQRIYGRGLAVGCPLHVSGEATVRESWDEQAQRFRISVRVENRHFGPLFGYHGSFTVVERRCPAGEVPMDVKPLCEQRQE